MNKNNYSARTRLLRLKGWLFTGLILAVSTVIGVAQTTLISPTGDGGFETGSTFAANGWTTVNATTNTWQVGAVPAWFTGSRGAYVSNNVGTSWAYTNTSASRSHFYRDIVFPAGQTNITLTFDWRGNGNDGNFDNLQVYIANTTVTPTTAGPTGTGTTATGWAGYTDGTTGYYLLRRNGTVNPTTTTAVSYTFTAAQGTYCAGNTRRLIFTWKNDGSGGTNPPASVDNISLVSSCSGPVATAATAVTNLSASANWGALAGATGYNVEYRVVGAGSWTAAAGNPYAGLTASLTGLSAATNYEYRVTGNGAGGSCTLPSNVITFTTATVTAVPWSEGFATTTLPTSWTNSGFFLGTTMVPVTSNGITTNLYSSVTTANFRTVFAGTLTGTESLLFDYRHFDFSSSATMTGTGNFTVGVSTDFGTTYTTIATVAHDAVTAWRSLNYSLAAYAGQVVTVRITGTWTTGDYYLGFDNFQIATVCSGTPNAGAATSIIPSSACSNGTFALGLGSGFSTGAGISYQWQSSTTSSTGPWTNISGATSSTYLASNVDVTTYYQCIVTCSFSGLTATSSVATGSITSLPITITSTVPNFCGTGGSATLTASSGTPYTYTWASLESGTLDTPPTTNPADVTVTTTSGFSVTGFDSGSGCTRVQFYSVGVYPFPSSTMTVDNNTICLGGTVNIGSGLSAASFSSSSIPHAPLVAPVSAKNLVSAGSLVAPNGIPQTSGTLDDGGWAGIPIGFNFNFFGTVYNTCNVGTNGTIMFGTYNGTALADFTFTTLPSLTEPLGMVAALAMDNNLSGATGGTLRYWTEGYAPNRKFVVSYEAVQEFGDTRFSTSQAIFYETLGTVEVHVTSSTNQDRNKLVGINGPAGDIGVLAFASGTAAAANNPIVTSFAYRFTPPANYNTVWSGDGVATPLTGTNLFTKAATPTSAGTKTYSLVYTNLVTTCSNSATPGTVTVEVLNPPTAPSVTSPINITGVQNVTITPTYAGTDVIRYWSALTGGTLLGTGASLTLPYVSASTAVYVETWNGGCNSGARLLVDIQYTAPTCASIPVGSIAVSNITFGNASLAWANPAVVPASGYEYAVTTSATPPASGTAAATNSATATGLSPATVYYVHVRGNCGAGDFSTWITSASFTTSSVLAPPYVTGFAPVPTGWLTTGFGISTSTTPAAGNPGAGARINLYGSVPTGFARTPYVGPLVGTENLSFDFSLADFSSPYAPPASGSGNFVVAISTDGGLTYTTLETVANDATAGWQFRTYPLAAYAGQTVTVRLTGNWTSGDYYLAFDNVEIATPPPCPKPYAISVSNITINSAQINGTTPNATNGVTIEYSTDNFTTTSFAYAASLPYTVTGLAGQTIYQFRLQSDCDVDGVSLYSNTGTFTTLPCLPTYSFGKTSGDLISRVEISGTTLSNNSGLAQTNPAYTFFSTGASNTADLVAGTQYTVEASIGSWGDQGIAAWVDYDDDGVFEASEKIGNTTGTIGSGTGGIGDEDLPDHSTTFQISLACNPIPGVHRMRVRCAWTINGEDLDPCANYGYGECEDYNVTILPPPPCPIVPVINFSSVISNSALASWPVGCAEGQWDLSISTTAGAPTVTNADVTVNSNYAITGLTPSTTYYVYIQADCIGDGNSSWTGPFSFTTLPPPPANDNCASATILPVNAGLGCTLNGSGTVLGATASAGPTAACGDFGDDVWFSFVATYTSHIITISNVTPFTTMSFQVMGSCGAPTALNCNNTTGTVSGLTPGLVYYVRVASNGSAAATSTFNICVTTPPPPPANDDYCNAATIAVGNGCTTTTGTFVSATLSGVPNGTCYFGTSNFDVWYKFVAPFAIPSNTASVIINTQQFTGGVTDGLMQLYSATGTCPGTLTFTQLACDDDSGPGLLPAITATGLTSGQTYYIRVHPYLSSSLGANGVADPNYGKFGICVVNAGAPVPANDNIANAINIPGTQSWYPQCALYSGDCTLSSNSTQSSSATGPDNWYRFTAEAPAVSIDMNSTGLDNAITLVVESTPGVFTELSYENANFAVGGIERLNYSGLNIGTTYYVSFGAAGGTTGGAFTGCVRQLLRANCNTNVSVPLSNCGTFKSSWTGANTYTYQFSPVGGSVGGGSINATGSISLANPSLNLVPGNTYNVIINTTYNLTNGVGTPEPIVVFGNNPTCANVVIVAHASVEVRATQRCSAPATLLKTSFLRTDPFVCGVTNYTFEFQPVIDCAGSATAGLPFTHTNTSRIISLNFPASQAVPALTILPQTFYRVRVRPNFGLAGVNQGAWGNPQIIFVGGSVLEAEQQLSEMAAEADRMEEESMLDALIYPNPSNGEVVNLNVANVNSDNVFVRIMDATGRIVYTNRYTVDGSLNTIVTFAQPLANGLYTVEFIMDDQRITERMMIQK